MKPGKETELDFKFEKGKIIASAMYDGKGLDATVSVMSDTLYFIEKLEEAVDKALPEDVKLDDMIFAGLKTAIAAIK